MSLLDPCIGYAIYTRFWAGQDYTTTDLRISYLRAPTDKVGPVRAKGRVVHLGRLTAVVEGQLYDVGDRLYAVGSTTCLVLHMAG